MQDRVPQARIYKVWNVPEFGSADGDYLDLVSDILSQGKSSHFYKRLVYDDQIATDAVAFVDLSEIAGQFRVQSTARPGQDLAQVEKALDEELGRFLRDGPTPDELERAKTQRMADFIRGIERIGGLGGKSDRLAQSQVFLGSPDAYKISLRRIQEATAEDLKSAANRWLADGVYVLEVHPFPPYDAASAEVDRTKAPEPGSPPELRLPKFQRATLANGLKIVLAERHEVPLVNFWMTFDAGYAADQFASAGTASMTTAVLDDGTATRTALEISDELARLGAELSANSNLDITAVRLSALKSKLDASLELFADVIQNPSFPEVDFRRQQKQQLAAIQREENTPVQIALRIFPRLLYGETHAYGNPLTGSGTPANIEKMTREDLATFHRQWFRPNNATLIVVGDTTLSEVTPKLERVFAGWQPGEVPRKNISPVQLPARPTVYIIDKPGALQSVIIGGHVAPPTANPREIAIEAMNEVLGGTFGARINMNLREDKHWTYGAMSRMVGAKGQRPFFVIAPVQLDKTKEAMAEIDKELRGLLSERPATPEELAKVQANETLSLPGSRETMNAVGQSIIDLVQFGLPDDWYETYAGKVRALRTADIDAAAREVIHPESVAWVVVGDRAKIEASVRELNLGEVKFLGTDGKPLS